MLQNTVNIGINYFTYYTELNLETVVKKWTSQKLGYSQFLPNQADIQVILPTDELVIFNKFRNNWIEIVDFY